MRAFLTMIRSRACGWLPLALLGGATVALFVGAALTPRFPGDLAVALWVQGWASPALDRVMDVMQLLGTTTAAVVTTLVVAGGLALSRRGRQALFLVVAVVPAALTPLLKALVNRPRPSAPELRLLEESLSHSFPSGHTLYITLLCGALLYLVTVRVAHPLLKRALQGLLVAVALLMGLSRVYLGAHWPSDVLGSYLLGGLILGVLLLACRRWERSRTN